MNAPRDGFCDDAPDWFCDPVLTDEQLQTMADEYQREQIASANSTMPDNEPAEDLG